MALIKCKDCKKSFSSDAQRCPYCGANKPGIRSGDIIALIVILGNFPKPLPMPTNNFHRMRVSGMTCRPESTWPIYPTLGRWPVRRPPPPGANPKLGRPAGRLERRAGRDDL